MAIDARNDLKDDVRIIQRNLAKGFASRQEVREKLSDLPDVADKGEWVDIALERDDDDADSDSDED
jgi:hypothetical protein